MNEKFPLALPEGTVLAGQYIVEKVLGQGGFGITYEATDHTTAKKVAVKEFFPDAMATRTNQTTVMPFSGERGESYEYGKTCFLQEAETLAKFIGNENIVRIHSYFEENGTAYFVMDYIEGTSFDEYIKQHGGKISYEEAARILVPVMEALSTVHSEGIIHRDVTPDNIYITRDGTVKLLDFGAARYSLGDKSRSLDVVLKHGFAPKEQYTRRGKQGPYTDVYSLGATFYFALTGKRPQDSVERMDEDDLVSPSTLGVQIGKAAEDAILQALSVQPAERFQSMEEFRNALLDIRRDFHEPETVQAVGQDTAVIQSAPAVEQKFLVPSENKNKSAEKKTGKKKTYMAAAVVAAAAVILVGFVMILLRVLPFHEEDTEAGASFVTNDHGSVSVLNPTSQTDADQKAVEVSAGNFAVLGGGAGNIMNNGHSVSSEEGKFFITDTMYCLKGPGGEYGYIYEKSQEWGYNSLALDAAEGKLYFTRCGYGKSKEEGGGWQAYYYDLKGGAGNCHPLDEINYVLDESNRTYDVTHLLLTEDYYVACCLSRDRDHIRAVYRVSRTDGDKAVCCTIDNPDDFTLSDDGWIYYTGRDGDGYEHIYRMRLDTLEKDSESFYYRDSNLSFSNPIVIDDYLYFMVCNAGNSSYLRIVRADKDFDQAKHKTVVWDIASRMKLYTFEQNGESIREFNRGFNVNKENHDIYCHFNVTCDDEFWPDLYQMKGYDDGSFDISLIAENAQMPCFIYNGNGNYDVHYYGYKRDEYGNYDPDGYGNNNYYQGFDADGNKITNETQSGREENLSVIGNDAGNIMNGGHTVAMDGEEIYIAGMKHSIQGTDGKEIRKRDEGLCEDLSLDAADRKLYYLCDSQAYFYDLAGEAGNYSPLNELNAYFGGNIKHLLLTENYYVVCCINGDNTQTIYRVSRIDGERVECCTVENSNDFTLSDDGWIYYICRNDAGCSDIYRMRLDTLERDSRKYNNNDPDLVLCNPIVIDNFLYFFAYRPSDPSYGRIVRYSKRLGMDWSPIVWNIGSKLNIRTDLDAGFQGAPYSPKFYGFNTMFGFNVNRENHDIFFYIGDDENDNWPDLYQMKGYDDRSFDIEKISENVLQPCFTYYEDGSYDVYYYQYVLALPTMGGPRLLNVHNRFDAEGVKIKSDIESSFKYFS